MTDTHPALLPNGLMDLLPDEAEAEASAISALMGVFGTFGYRRVKPPLVEFEDSLLAPGPGAAMTRQTFRLMDPVTQRMMGVRADTTAQIARIASSRLADQKRPLRLSYAADVLRVQGTQIRPARQFCQVGCELIGAGGAQDDAEIMLLSILSLRAIGIQDVSIDLTVPSLAGAVMGVDERGDISSILKRRDRDALSNVSHPAVSKLLALLDASGPADVAVQKIKEHKLPDVTAEIDGLIAVYRSLLDGIAVYGLKDINITIDWVEHRGLDYETGIGFTLFSNAVRGELGGGGRYRTGADSATGFTLYMDSLLPALTRRAADKTKHVAGDAPWKDIKDIQDKGFKVERG